MLSIFCAPARYVQGQNATRQLGPEMAKLGLTGKVLILAGRAAKRHLPELWAETFDNESFEHRVMEFSGECSRDEIDRIKAEAQGWHARVIVGAGGGKVLDTARAVAFELDLPVVNCPTVASSDAPCSALSVVYTSTGEFDTYLFYRRNPDLVLVDTSIVAMAPRRLLVAGMGDALATWFEARTVRDAQKHNQVGGKPTGSASALARLCYETLIEDGVAAARSCDRNEVTPELERLIEANTLLSGLGFESGGLAVAHSVHNGLTTIEETHEFYHGEKVAFGTMVQLVLENRPDSEIKEVLSFSRSVGLPTCLADLGLENARKEQIERIALRTVAPGETAHNEPFAIDSTMVVKAIVEADRIGRQQDP